MQIIQTWGGLSEFKYEGSVSTGTWICWKDKSKPKGWSEPSLVSADDYRKLLSRFSGEEVAIGSYRLPVGGTLEDWLKTLGQEGMGLYICKILVSEGYAERSPTRGRIIFKRAR